MIDERRRERIARADGVGESHRRSGMLDQLIFRYQQAAACAARDANQSQITGLNQAVRDCVFAAPAQFEHPGDAGQFLVVEFDDGRGPQRFGEDFQRIKILPQVHVEDAQRRRARAEQETPDRLARGASALRERPKAVGVGVSGQKFPLRRPRQLIPHRAFRDDEIRLPVRADAHLRRPRQSPLVALRVRCVNPARLEPPQRFIAERINPDAAGDHIGVAEGGNHAGETGLSAAGSPTAGLQHVPQQFAHSDDCLRRSLRSFPRAA